MPEGCVYCGGSGNRCCEFGTDQETSTAADLGYKSHAERLKEILDRERREHPLPSSYEPR